MFDININVDVVIGIDVKVEVDIKDDVNVDVGPQAIAHMRLDACNGCSDRFLFINFFVLSET